MGDAQGSFLRSFGTKGRKPGMFKHPNSVTVDNENSIFVCDLANHRVQVFDVNGEFKHKWGGFLKKVDEGDEGGGAEGGGETPENGAEWYGCCSLRVSQCQ